MSKNPKINIALAFILTFLIGLGAGYMLRGLMQASATGYVMHPNQDPAAPPCDVQPDITVQQESPVVQHIPETTADPYETEQERSLHEDRPDARFSGRMDRRPGNSRGMSEQRSDMDDVHSARRDEGTVKGGEITDISAKDADTSDADRPARVGVRPLRAGADEQRAGRRMGYAGGEGAGSGAGAGYRSMEDRQNDDGLTGTLSGRTSGPEQLSGRRIEPNGDQDRLISGRDSRAAAAPADTLRRDERRRDWRSDEDRTQYNRIRLRIVRDLGLSEAEAENFFSALEEHRRLVREQVVAQQAAIRHQYQKLNEKLENDLSKILNEEQMTIWKEKYAPRMDAPRRGRSDAADDDQE